MHGKAQNKVVRPRQSRGPERRTERPTSRRGGFFTEAFLDGFTIVALEQLLIPSAKVPGMRLAGYPTQKLTICRPYTLMSGENAQLPDWIWID